MDRKLILAVAGSGKTTLILDQLDLKRRYLVVTYTISNVDNLRTGIIRKFGYFPSNIRLYSYFNFLYSFCYRPFLLHLVKSNGINWMSNPNLYAKEDMRYLDHYKRLYSNRIVRFLENRGVIPELNSRLEKYFDHIFIDEIQDFAGHDFNLLKHLKPAKLSILLVGDFYQHTFDTSRDGIVNANLHSNYDTYKSEFTKLGFNIDLTTLLKSHRCSPTICNFISKNIGIEIYSHRTDECLITVVKDEKEAEELYHNQHIIKLFYQESAKYNCFSKNWGDCKGEDKYEDVCVVMNKKTWSHYIGNDIRSLSAQTKNKLYVGCSRAKRNLYFIEEEHFKKYKAKRI